MSIKIIALCGIIVLNAYSCEKDEPVFPSNQAKGRIIETFRMCYGYWVMIEVDDPLGIGVEGEFAFPGDEGPRLIYSNAIGVPYFHRIPELDTEAPDTIGTWLHFKYRKLTADELHSNIFIDTSFHGICLSNVAPPYVNMYIVTEIIDYQ
jgi:hypothetical protein